MLYGVSMAKVLLTPREVDLLLCYSAGRSLRLAKAGKLPFILLPDGALRFDAADIDALLQRNRQGADGKASDTDPQADGATAEGVPRAR